MLKKVLPVVVLIAGGILFLVLGIGSIREIRSFPETEAVVSRVERDLITDDEGGQSENVTVYVQYRIDGKDYEELLQSAKGSVSEGDRITVHYNPDKPEYVTGATKGSSMLAILAGAACLIGGILLGIKTAKDGKNQHAEAV